MEKQFINYDVHIHTHFSDCAERTALVDGYVERAKQDGLTTIGFSDHMWDSAVPGASNWYRPQDFEHVRGVLNEIPKNPGIRVLFGCECECNKDGVVAITEDVCKQLDYVLVPHGHDHMKNLVIPAEVYDDLKGHAEFSVRHFLDIVKSPLARYFTAIAHPFASGTCWSPHTVNELVGCISDRDLNECFKRAKDKDIAIEVNGSLFVDADPTTYADSGVCRVFTIAKENGCTFTYGSDSHAYCDRRLDRVEAMLKLAGISEKDFLDINTIQSKYFD